MEKPPGGMSMLRRAAAGRWHPRHAQQQTDALFLA